MKFAHSLIQELEAEGFPPEWQASAIQYKQLKKCIKRVTEELHSLGLSAEMLKKLINAEGDGQGHGPVLEYMFDGTMRSFHPKLVLKVDPTAADGTTLDLGFEEETRKALEELARRIRADEGKALQRRVSTRTTDSGDTESDSGSSEGELSPPTSPPSETADFPAISTGPLEIPLFADIEFFDTLTSELKNLEQIQSDAKKTIELDIMVIGDSVTRVAQPKTFNAKSDLYPWREIFREYLETGVFFSTQEADAYKERTPEEAKKRLELFQSRIQEMGLARQFKQKNSTIALQRFLEMNEEVLKVLRFQSINKEAMRKILKKFDKRTALGAKQQFPVFVSQNNFLASQLARAVCYTMSSRIINIIPQLDDYLCPICQCISVKPVRLECSHVFCVRCLVKLQREMKSQCPMCRGNVVLKADASSIDASLLRFLKVYFPKESREKQKENEREVVAESWEHLKREGPRGEPGCGMM